MGDHAIYPKAPPPSAPTARAAWISSEMCEVMNLDPNGDLDPRSEMALVVARAAFYTIASSQKRCETEANRPKYFQHRDVKAISRDRDQYIIRRLTGAAKRASHNRASKGSNGGLALLNLCIHGPI